MRAILVNPVLRSPMLIASLAVAGLLLAATLALWMHYGTAVFFEVLRAGWVACF